jgi:glycosyltransferase involved in cell wall biosynthesis
LVRSAIFIRRGDAVKSKKDKLKIQLFQGEDAHVNDGRGADEIEISVVLPIFEEGETIKNLILSIIHVLSEYGSSFEVIAVDDGSEDDSLRVLRELKQAYPDKLKIVKHLHNKGNGASLRTGIRVAQGNLIVTMDADGQHSGEDIPKLLLNIPPYDLVIGSRIEGYQGSWYRGVANIFYNRFASWLSQTEVKDLTSGFRAMRRQAVLHFLPLFPNGFSAPTTTTLTFLKAGYNVKFVPIEVGQRVAGESKISVWRDGMRFIMIILRMIMLYDPLRIFLISGGVLSLLGLLAWIAGLLNAGRLVFPNSAIFLFSTAIVTWLLGLVSDQITSTRIHYYGDESVVIIGEASEEKL